MKKFLDLGLQPLANSLLTKKNLKKKEKKLILTMEPGGTRSAESIRKLILRDYFNKGSWKDLLVEGEMEIRISMHAGPVYEEFDPILNRRNFFGRHVNQAARIEPIVLPGSVFVSETVAALISFGYEKYDFEYAGNLELAKDFGSYPIYMLQRKGYSGEEERA